MSDFDPPDEIAKRFTEIGEDSGLREKDLLPPSLKTRLIAAGIAVGVASVAFAIGLHEFRKHHPKPKRAFLGTIFKSR